MPDGTATNPTAQCSKRAFPEVAACQRRAKNWDEKNRCYYDGFFDDCLADKSDEGECYNATAQNKTRQYGNRYIRLSDFQLPLSCNYGSRKQENIQQPVLKGVKICRAR